MAITGDNYEKLGKIIKSLGKYSKKMTKFIKAQENYRKLIKVWENQESLGRLYVFQNYVQTLGKMMKKPGNKINTLYRKIKTFLVEIQTLFE